MNNIFKVDFENRILGLDILRAAAIFFVVFAHGNKIILPHADHRLLNIFRMDGVALFFVLSGFLIGRILIKIYFKENNLEWKDLWGFWVRRWFRTVPPYFIMLTILIIMQMSKGLPFDAMYVKFYLFIQNLWYPHPPFFPEAWSLSVEEWFYLTFPFLLFLGAKLLKFRSRPAFLFTVGCFFLMCIGYRAYISLDALNQGMTVRDIYGPGLRKIVIARFDSMMFGVLAAYIYYFHQTYWNRKQDLWFFLGLMLLFISKLFPWGSYPLFDGVFSFIMTSLGTFFLLPKLNSIKTSPGWFSKFIILMSISSYSMYLVNLTFRDMVLDMMPHNTPASAYLAYFVFWLITIVVSVLAYRFIEYPILRFRDKLYKKQSI